MKIERQFEYKGEIFTLFDDGVIMDKQGCTVQFDDDPAQSEAEFILEADSEGGAENLSWRY